MCACFRIGAVVLPCTEQLRAKDLRLRLAVATAPLIVADERNRARAGGWHLRQRECDADGSRSPCCTCPTRRCSPPSPPPRRALDRQDPCLITFTSGTAGEPKAVLHGQRYLRRPAPAGGALAGRARGRAGVVHGRLGLVEVGAQRVHRALAVGRERAAARRALRPGRAPGAARARARERAVHGADRVPRDRRPRAPCARCPTCARWSPRARRSTRRCCTPGARRPAWRSATATARPRPAR